MKVTYGMKTHSKGQTLPYGYGCVTGGVPTEMRFFFLGSIWEVYHGVCVTGVWCVTGCVTGGLTFVLLKLKLRLEV